MADPFITAQDLTDYIGVNVTADPGATIAIDAACDMVRTVASQTFNRGTTTVVLDGTGTDALRLPQLPVNNAGTVLVAGTAVTDYQVDKEHGYLYRGTAAVGAGWTVSSWPEGRQNVSVTYEHGYTSVPRDVRMVALTLAARMVVQGVAQFEEQGDSSVRYAVNSTDFTAGEKMILHRYKSGNRAV